MSRKLIAHSFKSTTFLTGLKGLDDVRRLAFGVCVLERAISAFFQFQIDTGSAGGGEVRAALAQCWSALEKGFQSPAFVSIEACGKTMPDSENYSSHYTSAAIDAVNIACCLLEFITQPDPNKIIEVVQSRRDTFDIYIQNVTDMDASDVSFEDQLDAHPLMQEELGFLHDDLAFFQAMYGPATRVWIETLDRVTTRDYRRLRLVL